MTMAAYDEHYRKCLNYHTTKNDGSEEYLIKWTSKLELGESSEPKSYLELYTLTDLYDVTICCMGNVLKAHKIVLAGTSSFFKGIFEERPRKHSVILIKDITIQTMRQILRLMYFGEVVVDITEINGFHQAAKYLEMRSFNVSLMRNKETKLNPSKTTPAFPVSVSTGGDGDIGIYKKFELLLQQLRESIQKEKQEASYKIETIPTESGDDSLVKEKEKGKDDESFHLRSQLLRAYLLQKVDGENVLLPPSSTEEEKPVTVRKKSEKERMQWEQTHIITKPGEMKMLNLKRQRISTNAARGVEHIFWKKRKIHFLPTLK